jgi:hypothetical protein
MALARIITRSQACSRELALALLSRGYAVEILSPDKVPDNIADLELRVDTGPGDQLIANVEAHNGERSASLEFVHHLKTPIADFTRRPPKIGRAVSFSSEPVSSGAALRIKDAELPAEAPPPAAGTILSAAGIPLHRDFDPAIDRNEIDRNEKEKEGARLMAAPVLSPPPAQPPGYFAVEDAAVSPPAMAQPRIGPPTQVTRRRDHSAGWPRRVALTFAAVVLVAVALGFSTHRTSKSAPPSEASPIQKIAVESIAVSPLSTIGAEKEPARDPGQVSAEALPPSAHGSKGNSRQVPKEAQVAKVRAKTVSPRTAVSRKGNDDLIARDTVTYLDKRFQPRAKAKSVKPRLPNGVRTTHDGGVVAANTVTYH